MKNFVSLVAIAALAACSQAEDAAESDTMADETAVTEQAGGDEAAGLQAGTYVSTYPDGTEVTFTTTADGTWSGTSSDGRTASGTVAMVDGKACFTSNPASEEDSCWTRGETAEDGSWTSTSDAGVTVTVRPATE